MKIRSAFRNSPICLALAGALALTGPGLAANTDIADEPLTQAATGVRPNILFILDDSGSMAWDFSPDYIDDPSPFGAGVSSSCFDSGDDTAGPDDIGKIIWDADACRVGDPPYMTPDFNLQYYDPRIWYRPRANSDGTDGTSMVAGNTSNWTAVPTDPYGQQEQNQLGQGRTTENLVANYPDRAWCTDDDDNVNNLTDCRVNSAYTYPDHQFNRTSDDGRFRFGGPYYYRMQTAQWCSTPTLDAGTCVSGSAVNPNVHRYIAPEFCTDSELTNCDAGAEVTPAHTFSGARWCSDKGTLETCQRKKVGSHIWPKHLGTTEERPVTLLATSATGSLTVVDSKAGEQVTSISVGGVQIIAAPVAAVDGSTSTLAANIALAINTHVSTPDYTASVLGNKVTITAVQTGVDENGKSISVAFTQTGTVGAVGNIEVENYNGNENVYVDAILVDHPELGAGYNIMSTLCSGDWGNGVDAEGGGSYGNRLKATNGTNSPNERASLAAGIASCINQATGTTGFSATRSGNEVDVRAPASVGLLMNGRSISVVKGTFRGNYDTDDFAGGQSSGAIISTSGSLQGGTNATSATIAVRLGVGQFARTNIDPANNSYSKASARFDCSGATCTYAEEMTNFSNWYAYYRTRMQMMKTAAGRAFVPIDDTYRVGFITINPRIFGSVHSSRYLRIQDFDAGHKAAWYTKFYNQGTPGGTPLREALSRAGRLFAGRFDGINNGIPSADDPIEVSCQPNFAILSTDGYWTNFGTAGNKIDDSAMDQQDNSLFVSPGVPDQYTTEDEGTYDGGDDATVGLADVAQYYYKNDLRPAGALNDASVDVSENNVPTTDRDFAAHQHMTTFTLGLGLDGTLSYRRDYQTANSGDFHEITEGKTGMWPNPVADSPTALDDLWHAAVNGRGVFFSASNPQQLASSLTDTLNALKSRVGAGAAAATSNLQPVAGDNFAFTAQYQTQAWVGDLKARTIDLSSGAIAFVELWSAQSNLNARLHTSRVIYTFDDADSYLSTSLGEVGNQMKHFCMPAALGAAPWCDDGPGLTPDEELLFAPPTKVAHYNGFSDPQKANATVENLVNYLRGHQAFEDQGNGLATDLFRERTALLGDIINAQPAYVKAAPFEYNSASNPGYAEFKACTENVTTAGCPTAQFPVDTSLSAPYPRRPTVYIASNDGMLHAIETDVNNNPFYQTAGIPTEETGDDGFSGGNNTGNGVERWAYIPSIVLPDLSKLANIPYSHRFLVDGSPTVGDICVSTPCGGLDDWRTILVGGLNAGGRGYYALDVTNPRNPRALWEFKVRKPSVTACAVTLGDAKGEKDDCDLGLSFGNPVISKLADGKWVVIVSSGYNNTGVEPGTSLRQGDGQGYLYILDAVTGEIIQKIGTGVGDPGTAGASYADADPSGLARINNWVDDSLKDNTTRAVYGGDMKGNLWRFDLEGDPATTTFSAVKIAALVDGFGLAQPVTTKPELGLINNRRVVFVATGRFLGLTDKATTGKQTVYAISDDLASNPALVVRADLVAQTITTSADGLTRTVSLPAAVDWSNASVRGWYVDLPDKGERVSVDLQLQLGTLVVPSNVPSNDTCVAGGTGWINTFDFKTGGFVVGADSNMVSQKVTGSVVVGINVIQLPGGKVVTVVTTADNQQRAVETPIAPTNFQGRRVGWRELNADQ
jgi:type IV pilus assembly protein PilY1